MYCVCDTAVSFLRLTHSTHTTISSASFVEFVFQFSNFHTHNNCNKMDNNQKAGDTMVALSGKTDQIHSTTTGSLAELPFKKVVVHPLVLLTVVDHFNRMGKIGNQKRVVGILLGSIKGKGILDISNGFAGKFCQIFVVDVE